MTQGDRSTITLRALEGEPLLHEPIREMVVAAAHGMAERQGIAVIEIQTTPSSITVGLLTNRLAALGFAAELRRVTTNWYQHKFNEPHLWGEPPTDDVWDVPEG